MKVILILFFLFSMQDSFCQQEGYAVSDSVGIYYRVFGIGRPILIINGGPGMNSDGFVPLAKSLANKYQTIIFDQRGTGKSVLKRLDSSTITMKKMIEDIEAIRKVLKIDQWIVLGHSFGGMLASYYACFYPSHIKGLILSSSGGINLGLTKYLNQSINSKLTVKQRDTVNFWNERIANGDTSYFARFHRGLALAHAYVYNQKFIPTIAERLTQGNNIVNGLIWADLLRIKFDCSGRLSHFQKPVLIIQGKQDIIAGKTAEAAHHIFKNSKIVIMDSCIHYGWLDQPGIYFQSVDKFMAKN